MSFSKKEFDTILQEETIKLLAEEGVQEGFLDRIKDLYKSFTKPTPNASQGVGRAFAGYKYKTPAKQTAKTIPQQEPEKQQASSTSLTKKQPDAMEPSDVLPGSQDNISATGTYDLGTEPKLPPSQQKALPPSQKSPETVQPSGDLPPSGNIPKQLQAPKNIGVADKLSDLQKSIDGVSYQNLFDGIQAKFFEKLKTTNLPEQEKQKYSDSIDTVLKYLISKNRILSNPTIVPKDVSAKKVNENRQQAPSAQQVGIEEWYINALYKSTKKHFSNTIDKKIIEFIITTLYQDGRIAISQRLYNKLIHTNDPRLREMILSAEYDRENIQESKDYKNFYNSWKQYTKTGVIL
jgi:hypothetical protein